MATDVGGNVGTAGSQNTGQDVSPTPPQTTNPNPGSNVPVPSADLGAGNLNLTTGWYLTIAVITSIMLANVRGLGVFLVGVLSVALIYQVGQLLQGQ